MNHKELIARLRVGASIEREKVVYSGWATLAVEAADALEELQAEVSRLEPLQFRQAPCHKFCEATAFEIEIRNLKKQLAMRGTA
jgi:hypothetical protein